MDKLTIAKYKNGYIKISDYNRSIHKQGEIFCPFCEPSLEVTGVQNEFLEHYQVEVDIVAREQQWNILILNGKDKN